jgi:hypothetical protein
MKEDRGIEVPCGRTQYQKRRVVKAVLCRSADDEERIANRWLTSIGEPRV